MSTNRAVRLLQVAGLFLAVMLLMSMAAASALAAAPVTMQGTVVMSGPPATMLPAGDDSNHLVGLGQRTGEAVFSDGKKAKYSNVFVMDLFRGKFANTWGYTKMLFENGSWFFFKWDAAFAGRDEAGNVTFAGSGKLEAGSGAYQGIQGTVKFTNRSLPPSKALPQGGTEAKVTVTYTLP